MTEILEAMTRPDVNGTPALPKRAAPKGLLPSTWLGRSLRIEYVDAYGGGQENAAPCSTSTRPAPCCTSPAQRR